MENVKEIIKVENSTLGSCLFCDSVSGFMNTFDETVNHYIKEHGFKLLHLGQETTGDGNWQKHDTVAVLGTSNSLKRKTAPQIDIDI